MAIVARTTSTLHFLVITPINQPIHLSIEPSSRRTSLSEIQRLLKISASKTERHVLLPVAVVGWAWIYMVGVSEVMLGCPQRALVTRSSPTLLGVQPPGQV